MNINENDEIQVDDFDLLPELPAELEESIEEPVIDETDTEEPDTPTEEVDTPTEADTSTEEAPEEDDLFAAQSFYDMLKERQLVPEKEITSWKDLDDEIEAYKTALPEQVRESIVKSTSEVAQGFVEFAINKPNLSEEDLVKYLDAYQTDKAISDIATDDQAIELLKPELVAKWGETVADVMLDSLKDEGNLIAKAQETNASNRQALEQAAIQERQTLEATQNQFVQSLYQEFDEQPWKSDHKEEIKEFYSSGKIDQTIAEIANDPKSLVQLVNIINYYDPKTKTFNLDTFFNKAATRSTNSIRNNIKQGLQNRGTSTKPRVSTKGFDTKAYELA